MNEGKEELSLDVCISETDGFRKMDGERLSRKVYVLLFNAPSLPGYRSRSQDVLLF